MLDIWCKLFLDKPNIVYIYVYNPFIVHITGDSSIYKCIN